MLSFLKGKKRVVGVDMGNACVKAIAFEEADGAVRIAAYGFAPVEGDDRAAALARALAPVGTGGRVVASVSGRSVTVRYVNMPVMGQEEFRAALPLEADKYMPYDVNELYLDGQKLGAGSTDKEMRVLMVSAKRTLVQEVVGFLAQAGATCAVVDVDSFALGNAYELTGLAPGGDPQPDIVALVDIGAAKTNINILKRTVSCFTREVYVGGKDMTEAIAKRLGVEPADAERVKRDPADRQGQVIEAVTSVLEDLGNEIRLSFDYFESQFEEEVQKVLLSGGGARLAGLPEALSRVFGKETAFWNPLAGLACAAGLDAAALQENAPQFAIAVGLAARIRASA